MYRQRKPAKRFSLLLLEEEEDYVADWVATCKWPANVSGCWSGPSPVEGRVRLCTRSLFFEPDDVKLPIVRLPFTTTEKMEAGGGHAVFSLTCKSVTKMKANMEEVPYVFEKGQISVWVFSLMYAPLSALLPTAQQLLAANKLPKPQRTAQLEAFVRAHEDSFVFDTSRLADFSERILLDVPASQLTPLVRERGHLVITNTRMYFQPLHNVSGDNPVRSHPLASVAAMARRRSTLRPLGLEVFFVRPSDARTWNTKGDSGRAAGSSRNVSPAVRTPMGPRSSSLEDLELMGGGQMWDAPSAFFAFRSEYEREAVAHQLAECPFLGAAIPHGPLPAAASGDGSGASKAMVHAHSCLLEAQGSWLLRVTAAWQAAQISNFDYLMYLNLAAGRSFNDLAQWPVFPWVICNWVGQQLDLNNPSHFRDLSKPVGALNPARLREFRKRYDEMPHDSFEEGAIPPFLYGTHYSTPGYVMYWLLRAAPAHMLRLQNGRFDAPDRLFHGMQESWESVNNSSTDVKELIPEFYLPGGTWLVNAHRLPLGVRQNGQPVGDVELPPWARDPEHFLAMHRAALEAPPVSRTLHHWVDLVFGYKQRGPAAEAADNLFYHLTYEGAVDVSKVTDPVELKAYETQINEFGQTPQQLFMSPHPARSVVPPAPDPESVFKQLLSAQQPSAAITTTTATTTTTASSGISGTESGHRALALALISALVQAAAFEPGAELLASQAAHPPPKQGSPKSPPLPKQPSPKPQQLSPQLQPQSQLKPPHSVPQQVGVAPSRSHGEQHAAQATGAEQEGTDSWTGSISNAAGSMASAAGNAAGGVVNAAGGMLAGLLKLGRYKSGNLPGSTPEAPVPPGTTQPAMAHTVHAAPAALPVGPQAEQLGSRQGNGEQLSASQKQEPKEGAVVSAASRREGDVGMMAQRAQHAAVPVSSASVDAAGSAHQAATTTHDAGSVTGTGAGLQQPSSTLAGAGDSVGDLLEQLSDLNDILSLQPASPATPAAHSISATAETPNSASWQANINSPAGVQQATSAKAHVWVPVEWSECVPEQLAASSSGRAGGAVTTLLPVARDSLSGVATWRPPGSGLAYVYCTTTGGLLRAIQVETAPYPRTPHSSITHSIFRSQQLEGDLLCLAPLYGSTSASSGMAAATTNHPLLLTGSHNQQVYVYSVQQGQLLGSFQAHDDAVSALVVPPPTAATHTDGAPSVHGSCYDLASLPRRFFTSSWDCTIKAWGLGGERAPWAAPRYSPAAQPEASWDIGEGIWALAAGPEGSHLVVGGSEEGQLVACDVRAAKPLWRLAVSQDYVGGVALTPCCRFVTAGTADGALTLLDVRHLGTCLAVTHTGSPVRCCLSDSRLLMAGTEAGSVCMWDVGLMSAAFTRHAARALAPGPDGQYRPWRSTLSPAMTGSVPGGVQGTEDASAVAAIAVNAQYNTSGGISVDIAVGREDGNVLFAACN